MANIVWDSSLFIFIKGINIIALLSSLILSQIHNHGAIYSESLILPQENILALDGDDTASLKTCKQYLVNEILWQISDFNTIQHKTLSTLKCAIQIFSLQI